MEVRPLKSIYGIMSQILDDKIEKMYVPIVLIGFAHALKIP